MQIVKILYDEEKNGISVDAPPDAVLTLGILEMAKAIYLEKLKKSEIVKLADPLVLVPELKFGDGG